MHFAVFGSPEFWTSLLRAELILTGNVVLGLVVGELILSSGIVDKLFAPLVPKLERRGIHRQVAGAMLVALGSARPAAAMLSASYADGEITRDEATFGALSLAFPAYLRRWVGTVTIATTIAGAAGFIYAAVLIVRSGLRFVWVVWLLRRKAKQGDAGVSRADATQGAVACDASSATAASGESRKTPASRDAKARRKRLLRMLVRSLPWAWGFFALTYALMPQIEYLFTHRVATSGFFGFLPPEGWAVSVSALAHVTAALASAGGALKAGDLDVSHAVLALLVGNMVGTITRTMRQNVGYWMGIFPREMMPGLVRWHLTTLLSLEIVSILLAWAATVVL